MANTTETLQQSLQDDMSLSGNETATITESPKQATVAPAIQVVVPGNSSRKPTVDSSTEPEVVAEAETTSFVVDEGTDSVVTETLATDSPVIIQESTSNALEEIDDVVAVSEAALDAVTTMVLAATESSEVDPLQEDPTTPALPILEIDPDELTKRPPVTIEEEDLQPIGTTAVPGISGKSTGVNLLALWIWLAVFAVLLIVAVVYFAIKHKWHKRFIESKTGVNNSVSHRLRSGSRKEDRADLVATEMQRVE